MNLYITADSVGQPNHGGGSVTWNESEALKSLGPCTVWGRDQLVQFSHTVDYQEPWIWDWKAHNGIGGSTFRPKLVHFYAGTFTYVVNRLKNYGAKVTYTAAAHDIEASKREHEKLGIPYDYRHLTDPELWKRYLGGYAAADVLICPSIHSANCMRGFGCTNRIEVIPHGVHPPQRVDPLPARVTVGYLGAVGPDKGLAYLLQAWKRLAYRDAMLVIAGRDSQHPWVQQLCKEHGGGNIWLRGWVENASDFYNSLSLYVQPSVTEGFGLEVLEAQAHGRPVLCSTGAGAADTVPEHWRFKPCDVDGLIQGIQYIRSQGQEWGSDEDGKIAIDQQWVRRNAERYSWTKIRLKYRDLWKTL